MIGLFKRKKERQVIWPAENGNYNLVNVHYNLGWDVNYHYMSIAALDVLLGNLSPAIKKVTVTNLTEKQERLLKLNSLACELNGLLGIHLNLGHFRNILKGVMIDTPYVLPHNLTNPKVVIGYDLLHSMYIILDSKGSITKVHEITFGENPRTISNVIESTLSELKANKSFIAENALDKDRFEPLIKYMNMEKYYVFV